MKTKFRFFRWLILLLLSAIIQGAWAQNQNPTQTVCLSAQTYSVDPVVGATFEWSISAGGTITSGNGTQNITIDWNIAGGPYTVSVYSYKSIGCPSITQSVSVTVVSQPTGPTLNVKAPNLTSVCDGTNVSATFITGSGGVGCSDAFQYRFDGIGLWTAYTPGNNLSTSGHTLVEIQGQRSGCISGSGCTGTSWTTLASWIVNPIPLAGISYTDSPFCFSRTTADAVTQTGTTGGTYTALPAGLTIDAVTGAITPNTSTVGVYTVTYTIAAAGGCSEIKATTSVTITTAPVATIFYAGSPFCKSVATAQPVTRTGTAGGNYSAPVGLTINATTGAITPGSSTAGTYTVIYTIAASGGCSAVTATTSVTINTAPVATINYAGTPFCKSVSTAQPVTRTGTAGGNYTAPVGLTINAATGAITPGTSTAGTYTVTYTIAASGGCSAVTTTTSVTITTAPSATISYVGTPYCTSVVTAQAATQTGTAGGTYTAIPAGLTINAATGAITPATSAAGTYTVTYSIPASGGCSAVSTTTSVTINTAPTATINYAGTPFCYSVAIPQAVTRTGTAGGIYTALPAGLTIGAATGAITPSTSADGDYTVSYTIAAFGGCSAFTATTFVTITNAPSATIFYADSPFCFSLTTPQAITQTGTSGGIYSALPSGLTIDATTGAIIPSTSIVGNYTVTYTIAAEGGCSAFSTATTLTITTAPIATISYGGSPFCTSVLTLQPVTRIGTTGGTYSSTVGLTINTTTGAIIPATSTEGTYIVTYTIAASGGCSAVTATASVTIYQTLTISPIWHN